MKKADLHVHSNRSEKPKNFPFSILNFSESYTTPQHIYKVAKERGMDFVTITDHNSIEGALELRQTHPTDTFVSMEATATFPEDGCDVHILIYDISEKQAAEINYLRKDIYELLDYLKVGNLLHALAHPLYPVNDKLTLNHLEKFMLLFDLYEGINGGRNFENNNVWMRTINALSVKTMEHLLNKYDLPIDFQPTIKKGFVAGSDDHAGLFIGKTFSVVEDKAQNVEQFLSAVRQKSATPKGSHNDYYSLAYMVVKVLYDHRLNKKGKKMTLPLKLVNKMLFLGKKLNVFEKIFLKLVLLLKRNSKIILKDFFFDLLNRMSNEKGFDLDSIIMFAYDNASCYVDKTVKNLCRQVEHLLKYGNILGVFGQLVSILHAAFVSAFYVISLQHLTKTRQLMNCLKKDYLPKQYRTPKKILWFSDTITDINGVSATLKELAVIAKQEGYSLTVASALSKEQEDQLQNISYLPIPFIYSFPLPFYKSYVLRIPSILKSLKLISATNPDEIYLSTPGPVCLLGLFVAKLLNIKAVGIYHTDFLLQTLWITKNKTLAHFVESYCHWFYSQCDQIKVPTRSYIDLLGERNYAYNKLTLFYRGVDTSVFRPLAGDELIEEQNIKIPSGQNLLFVGRVSQDKNIDFLIEIANRVKQSFEDINLIIAGDGPYLETLRKKTSSQKHILFLGRVHRSQLPNLYSLCDIFVFPSATDTFGMVVVEAQACGIPVIVSSVGGPKDLVVDSITGLIAQQNNLDDWVEKVQYLLSLKKFKPETFNAMKHAARHHVVSHYSWYNALAKIFVEDETTKISEDNPSVVSFPVSAIQ